MNESADSRVVSQIRVRALFFLVLAIVAGGGAVFLVKTTLDRARSASSISTVETVPIVVAKMDIPIAARLEEQHLEIVQWPKAHAPERAYHTLKEVLDSTVQTNVFKGEPILEDRLASEDEGRGLAALLAPGIRAMAVNVDSAVDVGGFVSPGDFVDVIATMPPDEEAKRVLGLEAARMSKIILQNIMVLAVGEHLVTQGTKPVQVKVVTLGVTPDQSERLALASAHGKITLTMRPRVDQSQEATIGATPTSLLTPDDEATLAQQRQPVAVLRPSRRHQPRPAVAAAEAKPAEPSAPVVEILRAGKIEERKLRIPEATP